MKRFEPLPDENVIIQEPKHWKNYIIPTLVAAACTVLLIMRAQRPTLNLISLLSGLEPVPEDLQRTINFIEAFLLSVLAGLSYLQIIRTAYVRYYVTDKRIITISGIIAVTYQEMLLSHCEMVYLNQNIYERLFRAGDVLCVSAGAKLLLDDVYEAVRFKQTILKLLTEKKGTIHGNE